MGVRISLSGLAAAVAEAGGIGVISAAMIGIEEPDIRKDFMAATDRALTREIRVAKERTKGVIGVNIMVALSGFDEMCRSAVAAGVDVIFAGAGLPMSLPGVVPEETGVALVPIVSSGRAAAILAKKWSTKYGRLPDGFVVEGPMAGGHLGFKAEQLDDPEFAIEKLVAEVVEAVKPFEEASGKAIPVIAAGGIYTGADIKRMLDLGASGVQMGTRFVATIECDADVAFKEAYVAAGKDDVTIIKSPVGMPGRALKNVFLDRVAAGETVPKVCPYKCLVTCESEKSPYCIAFALLAAQKGHLTKGFAFCGANAWRVDKIVTVQELMDELVAQYEEAEKAAA